MQHSAIGNSKLFFKFFFDFCTTVSVAIFSSALSVIVNCSFEYVERIFYSPDALPGTQLTLSVHSRHVNFVSSYQFCAEQAAVALLALPLPLPLGRTIKAAHG